ncbi:hypothetical protein MMC20_006067 [Loxospora ochrophaea]|nr:hypothetical protein [Loxospora ochrophaea]
MTRTDPTRAAAINLDRPRWKRTDKNGNFSSYNDWKIFNPTMNEVTALLEAFESGKLYKDSLKTKAIPNLPKYCKLSDSAVGLLIAANISYASLSVCRLPNSPSYQSTFQTTHHTQKMMHLQDLQALNNTILQREHEKTTLLTSTAERLGSLVLQQAAAITDTLKFLSTVAKKLNGSKEAAAGAALAADIDAFKRPLRTQAHASPLGRNEMVNDLAKFPATQLRMFSHAADRRYSQSKETERWVEDVGRYWTC